MLVQLLIGGVLPFLYTLFLLKISTGTLYDNDDKRKNKLTNNPKQLFFTNLVISIVPFAVIVQYAPNIQWTNERPLYITAIEVWVMLVLADIFNYMFHRLCHENRFLYKTIHYVHHEYIVPDEIWSFWYEHPLETFLIDIVFALPFLLWETTFLAVCLYGSISILLGIVNHLALKIPPPYSWFINSRFHYVHHTAKQYNYAEHFTLVDRLFGTYQA